MSKRNIKRNADRSQLAGEYKFGDSGQILLLIIFLTVWITDSFVFHYSSFISGYITFRIRLLISLVIFFCSVYLTQSGLNTIFRKIRKEPVVISSGVFRIVRHPIYLGSIMFYLGLGILFPSIASIFILVCIVFFYLFISKYEEELLVKKFGIEYEQYQRKTPMLIPSLRKLIIR
ncbi:isoprenylcysteine carboxylmethyltransferase family protein [bacterium]|nr:isoprenylcysteine carboxylmethyltransferase family protein [bacterium]